jgi:hypothetical protein
VPANLAAAIYGAITIGSVVAIESATSETYLETFVGALLLVLIYMLAHAYAESASGRLKKSEPLELPELRRTIKGQFPMIPGAAIPLAPLIICWAIGAPLQTGVTATVWTSAVSIVALELLAGIRAKRKGHELVAQVAFGTVLGVLILALRIVLH